LQPVTALPGQQNWICGRTACRDPDLRWRPAGLTPHHPVYDTAAYRGHPPARARFRRSAASLHPAQTKLRINHDSRTKLNSDGATLSTPARRRCIQSGTSLSLLMECEASQP
jgi:hypothetical protein